jgi:hypothetical protein
MTKNIVVFIYEPYENFTMYEFKTYTEALNYIKKRAIHPDDVLVYSDPVEVSFRFLQGLADEEERGK